MNKKYLLTTALAVFAITALSTASALTASAKDVDAEVGQKFGEGPNQLSEEEREERLAEREAMREAVEAALEAGDYDEWVEVMIEYGRDEVADEVTEDEFPEFVEAHELMGEARGLMGQAGELMSGIGLEVQNRMHGRGMHGAGPQGQGEGLQGAPSGGELPAEE